MNETGTKVRVRRGRVIAVALVIAGVSVAVGAATAGASGKEGGYKCPWWKKPVPGWCTTAHVVDSTRKTVGGAMDATASAAETAKRAGKAAENTGGALADVTGIIRNTTAEAKARSDAAAAAAQAERERVAALPRLKVGDKVGGAVVKAGDWPNPESNPPPTSKPRPEDEGWFVPWPGPQSNPPQHTVPASRLGYCSRWTPPPCLKAGQR